MLAHKINNVLFCHLQRRQTSNNQIFGRKKLLPFHIFYSAVFKRHGKRISLLFTIKGPTYLKQVHDGSEAGFEGEFEVKGLW